MEIIAFIGPYTLFKGSSATFSLNVPIRTGGPDGAVEEDLNTCHWRWKDKLWQKLLHVLGCVELTRLHRICVIPN